LNRATQAAHQREADPEPPLGALLTAFHLREQLEDPVQQAGRDPVRLAAGRA
jgi:hypothetical protein